MNNKHDDISTRMKRYELVTKNYLTPRTPVIIRVDGKAFHTFTKKLNNTIDPSCDTGPSELMHQVMIRTAYYMSKNIQNVVVAYTQSDEISFVLKDWNTTATQQWFGGNTQKMASVAASMATAYFNLLWSQTMNLPPETISDLAMFDARVYNLPKEEVNNYLVWRQQDATRNSVQFLGHLYFSHSSLHKKTCNDIRDMLLESRDINWNHEDTWKKRGSCVIRHLVEDNSLLSIDEEIPIFSKDKEYIDSLISNT